MNTKRTLPKEPLQLDGETLTIEDIVSVARNGRAVKLADSARAKMLTSLAWVEEIVSSQEPVYGINTGFGIFADRRISPRDTATLNRNLILSHAVATGPALPVDAVRAAMLIRANTLASGYSGVRPVLVETLLEMLNRHVVPLVPSQGSLGSSGDLAPLAHLALVFTTDQLDREEDSGLAFNDYAQDNTVSGKKAMQVAGITRIVLGPKEGLALTNGATFSTAITALAVHDAISLLDVAAISLSMSLEALLGVPAAFDPRLQVVRNHPGQIEVAERVRRFTQGSTLLDAAGRIQDAYSLRCAPQVQGAALDAIRYIYDVISREINAATDNPLFFSPGVSLSGGNFHGEPVGLAADFLSIAISELAAISERRTFRLTDGKLNAGLPPMLVDDSEEAGLNSGLMMAQYTAASLVLENQTLASPDSVRSLPTSAEQEDHNANSMTAARHAHQIVQNAAHILAIEVFCAARALDLRLRQIPDARMGAGVAAAHAKVREYIPYRPGDAWWGPELEAAQHKVLYELPAAVLAATSIDG
jgi:histidine ammonia-lyase